MGYGKLRRYHLITKVKVRIILLVTFIRIFIHQKNKHFFKITICNSKNEHIFIFEELALYLIHITVQTLTRDKQLHSSD